MAGSRTHDNDCQRVRAQGINCMSWKMGGGGLHSNGSSWHHESRCVCMFNTTTHTKRNCLSGGNSWSLAGGRDEPLVVNMATKQYASRIRVARCHEARNLLDVMLFQRLTSNVIISEFLAEALDRNSYLNIQTGETSPPSFRDPQI